MYCTFELGFLGVLLVVGNSILNLHLFPFGFWSSFRIVVDFFLGTMFTSSIWSCLRTFSPILNRVIRLSSENSFVLCLKVFLKSFNNEAWYACEAALDDIRGSPEESYKILPRFAYILELNNSGYVVEYKVYADGRFLYFFMALSASISGWQHCRPVISIDGTSLKNKYGGTLLSASTPDANDQIFPLAFCVMDYENDSS
ncbi:protein FAR-RED ELONGATED HYPOCOTYL 3-like [Cucumis melo var. makuwa]|uniref:Protein FAR-RED ELONGATED HYPOCOTYL 3-like n=1 Tax=Cucumis melo var. makuwa TaxID=1194695 RepID=A0A5A7T779_CUCMM|nr:protein FAR-RED ELONGATED HYPOCOTYL 3-like [Cucumis melo var. makuwa]